MESVKVKVIHVTCGWKKKFPTFCSLAQRILIRLTWTKKFKCCTYYGKFEKRIYEYIRYASLKENQLFVKKVFSKMVNFEGWHQKSWFFFQIPKKILVAFPNRFKIVFRKLWRCGKFCIIFLRRQHFGDFIKFFMKNV